MGLTPGQYGNENFAPTLGPKAWPPKNSPHLDPLAQPNPRGLEREWWLPPFERGIGAAQGGPTPKIFPPGAFFTPIKVLGGLPAKMNLGGRDTWPRGHTDPGAPFGDPPTKRGILGGAPPPRAGGPAGGSSGGAPTPTPRGENGGPRFPLPPSGPQRSPASPPPNGQTSFAPPWARGPEGPRVLGSPPQAGPPHHPGRQGDGGPFPFPPGKPPLRRPYPGPRDWPPPTGRQRAGPSPPF